MSRAQNQPGGALITTALTVISSTTATQLFAASSVANIREITSLSTLGSLGMIFISASSTGTSTSGHAVPGSVPFRLGSPMMRGAVWAILGGSTGTATVTTFSC